MYLLVGVVDQLVEVGELLGGGLVLEVAPHRQHHVVALGHRPEVLNGRQEAVNGGGSGGNGDAWCMVSSRSSAHRQHTVEVVVTVTHGAW